MKGYKRLPLKNLLDGKISKTMPYHQHDTISRRAVAWVVAGKVFLTPRGLKELREQREEYGNKPCKYCRFKDLNEWGWCVLQEPDVCLEPDVCHAKSTSLNRGHTKEEVA